MKFINNSLFKFIVLLLFSFSMSLIITTPKELYVFSWTLLIIPLLFAIFNYKYDFSELFIATFIVFTTSLDAFVFNVNYFKLFSFRWFIECISIYILISYIYFFFNSVINNILKIEKISIEIVKEGANDIKNE